jgi:DNA-binding CsgD family transcriptional regulator
MSASTFPPVDRRFNNPNSTTLTERDHRIIELVVSGLKNYEIGIELGISGHMAKNHVGAIYDKLGLWNRVELTLWYESRKVQ